MLGCMNMHRRQGSKPGAENGLEAHLTASRYAIQFSFIYASINHSFEVTSNCDPRLRKRWNQGLVIRIFVRLLGMGGHPFHWSSPRIQSNMN